MVPVVPVHVGCVGVADGAGVVSGQRGHIVGGRV